MPIALACMLHQMPEFRANLAKQAKRCRVFFANHSRAVRLRSWYKAHRSWRSPQAWLSHCKGGRLRSLRVKPAMVYSLSKRCFASLPSARR